MNRLHWFANVAIAPLLLTGLHSLLPSPALAQISAAIDGTNSTVHQTGNTFNITGGTQAGSNLFHSFQQFGLNQGQIANFLSNSAIQNILGRVTGGTPSAIDGLIRISGSNANLYLMNPAGILFGANARLDVPGSFTATTASGIQFGNGAWFNATGTTNYASLIGQPQAFAFASSQPGAIVNAANLAVGTGQSITLLGGTIVNTGILSAPHGTVTVAAVPGEKLVRVSQVGSLLSLEFVPLSQSNRPQPVIANPVSLPQLLTGGNVGNATGLTVENGVVKLVGSDVTVPSQAGDVTIANRIHVAGATGGTVQVLGDRVNLAGARIDASGLTGGGQIFLGGDFKGQGMLPPAKRTFISADSIIEARAQFNGDGGRVIVWADDITGFYGQINASGGLIRGDGGFVEVSGKQNLAFNGQVDVSAPNGIAGTLLLDPQDIVIQTSGVNDNQLLTGVPNPGDLAGQILAGDGGNADFTLSANILENQPGNILLEATNNITIAPGVSLFFPASTGTITFRADADGNGAGRFAMDSSANLEAPGRSLVIAGASVTLGNISTFDGGSNFGTNGDIRFPADSGSVTVTAINNIEVQRIFASNVALISQNGDITTGSISSEGRDLGPGSQVILSAVRGAILLDGFIRAGQTNKTTDSTITIEAGRFRAMNPASEIESDAQGNRVRVNGVDQLQPFSLYAYPRNVDAGGDDSNGVRKVGTGQFAIGIGDDPFILTGSGNQLVTIRILEDTSFSIGRLTLTGSGTQGVIGIGAERAPSAIVLLRDNVFNANIETTNPPTVVTNPPEPTTPTIPSTVATVLENQQETTATVPECIPVAQTALLDVSAVAVLRGDEREQATANSQELPPCEPAR